MPPYLLQPPPERRQAPFPAVRNRAGGPVWKRVSLFSGLPRTQRTATISAWEAISLLIALLRAAHSTPGQGQRMPGFSCLFVWNSPEALIAGRHWAALEAELSRTSNIVLSVIHAAIVFNPLMT